MKQEWTLGAMKRWARVGFVCGMLILGVSHTWARDLALDLNGFRLWQYRDGVERHFAPAFKKFEKDAKEVEAYLVTDQSYMVFEFWKKFPRNVFSIQITGYPSKMVPFKGLVLGDAEEKVRAVLGKPSSVEKLEKPAVTIHRYDGKNFEIEIDAHGRLYTIKLHFDEGLLQNADFNDKHWEEFRKAVLSQDVAGVFRWMRPDIQIHKDGKTKIINARYGDFTNNPEQSFMSALLGARNSVRSQIQKQKGKPEKDYRLVIGQEKGDQGIREVGLVYKFPDDSALEEIVFFPYDGKHRVSEVRFRSSD